MLSLQEYLLVKLSEEAAEVSQSVSKALIFGLNESQTGLEKNNAQRLEAEIIDFLGVVKMLSDAGVIDVSSEEASERIDQKVEKVERYMRYSASIGTLDPSALDLL